MPTSNEFLAQLIQQAATKRESSCIVSPEPWLSVDTSQGSVTITLPRERTLANGRIEIQNIQLERIRPNANGDIFPEVRPGGIVNSLWGSEVVVSRLVPPPPPPATGPVERRYRISEEPGLAVVNLAGVRQLEISTREVYERTSLGRPEVIDQCALCGGYHVEALECQAADLRSQRLARARQEIMAEEDRRIFAELDRLGRDVPEESAQSNRNESFAPPFWYRTGQRGNYGWHTTPPPPSPRPPFIEPSYVNAPAARWPVRRVQVPEFEIDSNPTVRLSDIRNRRFNPSGAIRDGTVNAVSMGSQVAYQPAPEKTYTNVPRPYCPTIWERLLGDEPV